MFDRAFGENLKKGYEREKNREAPFHVIIGEVHLHDTPINTAMIFHKEIISKKSTEKIVLCLEVVQEKSDDIKKYLNSKNCLSDTLHTSAVDGHDYDSLSKTATEKMKELRFQSTKKDVDKSILMNLMGRKRVKAYEKFCTYCESNGVEMCGIDFLIDYSRPPFTYIEEERKLRTAIDMRSLYMLKKLFEFQEKGYSTISIVGRQHLLDLRDFLESKDAPKLVNYHFFNIDDITPFSVPESFHDSIKNKFSLLGTEEVKWRNDAKNNNRITYYAGDAQTVANNIFLKINVAGSPKSDEKSPDKVTAATVVPINNPGLDLRKASNGNDFSEERYRILIMNASSAGMLNSQSSNGKTALHWAVFHEQSKIAELLLEARIDTSIHDKEKKTALDIAKEKGYKEIQSLLERRAIVSTLSSTGTIQPTPFC